MVANSGQHSEQCWQWSIPADFVPTAPRFQFGAFVPLAEDLQDKPGVTLYGQVRGIFWDEPNRRWMYDVQPPLWHTRWMDIDLVAESEALQRLRAARN